ncbi:nucleotidyltransferase family protein [Flammeovirga kamogawensis]|uniref:Nucleotidyltransferase family protein n=1 Tax=Flammeovirga kamogawensis TaxID=373891 RepID=A0ABX8GT44_9BACT|nr:nucleotidyltransferase family protein [Flammeovirga kamogawensis]MBB6463887.1 molybdenum cofactor cytidylyltransferase [Flammeovirga kamogawensis]QWG06589.1 nucleotidyltransferase family protein [Flammeovirga kamogawensis]TRX68415.1 nucleotidyltransferase family protein [Flammeovirga kamogawensis]
MDKKLAILIVAAGASKRLGRPKQLLKWRGETLLNHCIEKVSVLEESTTFLILGAYKNEIEDSLKSKTINVIDNQNWNEGLGSSIREGIYHIKQKKYTDVLIVLSDLPLLSIHYIKVLIASYYSSSKKIAVTSYGNVKGVPVIFNERYFSDLLQLKGDEGAKKIVQKFKEDTLVLESDVPYIDIDTEEAYLALLQLDK